MCALSLNSSILLNLLQMKALNVQSIPWMLWGSKRMVPFVMQTSYTNYINLIDANKWNVTRTKGTNIIGLTVALNDYKIHADILKS